MKRVRRRYAISAEERAKAGLLGKTMGQAGRRPRIGLHLHFGDGSQLALPLSRVLAGIVADVIGAMAEPGGAMLLTEDQEVSLEAAADILGVSRGLLRRRMDAGEIVFHQVGTHRRLRLANVLAQARKSARARCEAGPKGGKTGALSRAKARGYRRRRRVAGAEACLDESVGDRV